MNKTLRAQVDDCKKHNAWDEAIALLEQAQEDTSQDSHLLGELAFCYSRVEQYKNAIEIYEQLCRLQPETARWPYGLGYQYYAQQKYAEAIPHFKQALELHPNYIAVLYRMGYALSKLGREKRGKALTAFERCREAFQSLSDEEQKDRERKHYARACFQQGKLFLEAGNLRLAEERLQEAVALRPRDADTFYNLGKVYVRLKKYDKAIDHLKAARRLSARPEHYILAYLGRAYLGAGELEIARRLYDSMPSYVKKRAYILRDMGELYAQLNEWEQAEVILRRAVKQDYHNHNGHFQLGLVLEQMSKYTEAARELKKANELRRRQYNRSFPEAEEALQTLLNAHPEVDLESEKSSISKSKSGRPVARVKVYFDDKGYGFLENKAQGKDYFFHISDVPGHDEVSGGDSFAYDVEETEKGLRAVNLTLVSS